MQKQEELTPARAEPTFLSGTPEVSEAVAAMQHQFDKAIRQGLEIKL